MWPFDVETHAFEQDLCAPRHECTGDADVRSGGNVTTMLTRIAYTNVRPGHMTAHERQYGMIHAARRVARMNQFCCSCRHGRPEGHDGAHVGGCHPVTARGCRVAMCCGTWVTIDACMMPLQMCGCIDSHAHRFAAIHRNVACRRCDHDPGDSWRAHMSSVAATTDATITWHRWG